MSLVPPTLTHFFYMMFFFHLLIMDPRRETLLSLHLPDPSFVVSTNLAMLPLTLAFSQKQQFCAFLRHFQFAFLYLPQWHHETHATAINPLLIVSRALQPSKSPHLSLFRCRQLAFGACCKCAEISNWGPLGAATACVTGGHIRGPHTSPRKLRCAR